MRILLFVIVIYAYWIIWSPSSTKVFLLRPVLLCLRLGLWLEWMTERLSEGVIFTEELSEDLERIVEEVIVMLLVVMVVMVMMMRVVWSMIVTVRVRLRIATLQSVFSISIVNVSLLSVCKYFVGFRNCSESDLGLFFIVRILIWMPFQRLFLIRFPNVLIGSIALNAQYEVEVASHSNTLFLFFPSVFTSTQ